MHPRFINIDLDESSSSSSCSSSITDLDSCLVQDNRTKLSRKRVQFAPQHTLHQSFPVTHLDDVDDNEIANTWYSHHELQVMKRAGYTTVQKLNLVLTVPETAHETTRGLEHLTHEGSLRRDFMKERIKTIVYRQDRLDDRQLRRVSRKFSRSSIQEAKDVAQQDAVCAEEYLSTLHQELIMEKVLTEEDAEDTLTSRCVNVCSLKRILVRWGSSLGRFSSAPEDALMTNQYHEFVIQVV